MIPPFKITTKIMNLVASISKMIGSYEAIAVAKPNPKLRKQNRIKTIKSTLAIEGNTCSFEQITAILEHKKVLGKQKEIQEVKNAISLYGQIDSFNPYSKRSFLKAHSILMKGLMDNPGKWRNINVGVLDGTKVKHLAPKPTSVPELMSKLFEWLKKEKELHPLIKSSIAHYEIEFIHPFLDGNGRMGRFWQTLFLLKHDEIFHYLPIESIIEKKQKHYYKVLEQCDKKRESTDFIEFLLEVIKEVLEEFFQDIKTISVTADDRIQKARDIFRDLEFSRKEYIAIFKNISTATASRDLKKATDEGLLRKTGEKNKAKYKFRK